jgi:hypothetical protein
VASRGTGADPGVQPDGQHVDKDLVRSGRFRGVTRLISGRVIEGSDHGGVPAHQRVSCSAAALVGAVLVGVPTYYSW